MPMVQWRILGGKGWKYTGGDPRTKHTLTAPWWIRSVCVFRYRLLMNFITQMPSLKPPKYRDVLLPPSVPLWNSDTAPQDGIPVLSAGSGQPPSVQSAGASFPFYRNWTLLHSESSESVPESPDQETPVCALLSPHRLLRITKLPAKVDTGKQQGSLWRVKRAVWRSERFAAPSLTAVSHAVWTCPKAYEQAGSALRCSKEI